MSLATIATSSRKMRGACLAGSFYLFTCEYCFSHYVILAFLILTRFKSLFDDWRGYLIAVFALVWVANLYMVSTTISGWISSISRFRFMRSRKRLPLRNLPLLTDQAFG